jgi:hypothetical protein
MSIPSSSFFSERAHGLPESFDDEGGWQRGKTQDDGRKMFRLEEERARGDGRPQQTETHQEPDAWGTETGASVVGAGRLRVIRGVRVAGGLVL